MWGLLRDYEPLDEPSFQALVVSPQPRPSQSAANSIIHGIIYNQFCQKYFCDTLLHREAMRHQAARRGWQIWQILTMKNNFSRAKIFICSVHRVEHKSSAGTRHWHRELVNSPSLRGLRTVFSALILELEMYLREFTFEFHVCLPWVNSGLA